MYCKKCGKELIDDAVVCTACGAWVQETPKKQEVQESVNKNAKYAKTFGIIAFSFAMAAVFFVCLGIADVALELYYYDTDYYYYYGVWESGGFAAAWIFSWFALGFGITSFVFGLKEKENVALKYISVLVFIVSVVVFFIPLLFI